MFKRKKFLAIIPARSGSKGLKNKNIKELNGKPMIAYTIEAAIRSKVFDDIVVSTDSEKYAQIAQQYGAWVPFLRPNRLATDNASTIDVIIHLLNELEKKDKHYDYFMLLQPTSPLRNEIHILESIELMYEKNANSVVSVCKVEHSPLWCNTLDKTLSLKDFIKKEAIKRRQDLPTYYRINGAIYLTKIDYFKENKDFYGEKSFAYIMDKENSIDVDDIFDFRFVEFLLSHNK